MEPGFIADSFQTHSTNTNTALSAYPIKMCGKTISSQNEIVTRVLKPVSIASVENQSIPCAVAPGNDRDVEDSVNFKENPVALDHIHISPLSSSFPPPIGSKTGTKSAGTFGQCVIPEYCDGMQSSVSFGKTETTTEKGSLAESDPIFGTPPHNEVLSETKRSTTNSGATKAANSDSDLIVPPDLLSSHNVQPQVLKPNLNVWFCFSAPSEDYMQSCKVSGRKCCNKRSAQVFPDMLADDGECLCSDSFPREGVSQNATTALFCEDVPRIPASQLDAHLPDVVVENIR